MVPSRSALFLGDPLPESLVGDFASNPLFPLHETLFRSLCRACEGMFRLVLFQAFLIHTCNSQSTIVVPTMVDRPSCGRHSTSLEFEEAVTNILGLMHGRLVTRTGERIGPALEMLILAKTLSMLEH